MKTQLNYTMIIMKSPINKQKPEAGEVDFHQAASRTTSLKPSPSLEAPTKTTTTCEKIATHVSQLLHFIIYSILGHLHVLPDSCYGSQPSSMRHKHPERSFLVGKIPKEDPQNQSHSSISSIHLTFASQTTPSPNRNLSSSTQLVVSRTISCPPNLGCA